MPLGKRVQCSTSSQGLVVIKKLVSSTFQQLQQTDLLTYNMFYLLQQALDNVFVLSQALAGKSAHTVGTVPYTFRLAQLIEHSPPYSASAAGPTNDCLGLHSPPLPFMCQVCL